ncbi:MAG: phage terminase large subunit [Nitrosopumilus sp.]
MSIKFDWSTANEGSQLPFIADGTTRHTGFIGGLGSGKSWAGAIKAILYTIGHPGSLGLIAAPTYRQLMDSTMREFWKLLPKELIKNFSKSDMILELINGSEIVFRSLENYEAIRGIELAWAWIDEANLISHKAWGVVIGRLRQPGFPGRTWITTTPRGKTENWLYEEYVLKVEKSPTLTSNRKIFSARTRDNILNIGEEYVLDLEATYTGEYAKQELLGQFVDLIEGRVYPQFTREHHVNFMGEEIIYNPNLPVYGFWDYGIADEAALWIAQTTLFSAHDSIAMLNPETGEMETRWIETSEGLLLIDLIVENGRDGQYWIDQIKLMEAPDHYGRDFTNHYGDPAGEQRDLTTGKSMAQMLREAGIHVRSKKGPVDQGRLIIHKLLNEKRLAVAEDLQIGIAAFQSYHWPLDRDGKRREGATKPVHDWASHPMDAMRYGVQHLFPITAASNFDDRNLKAAATSRAPKGQRTFSRVRARQHDW